MFSFCFCFNDLTCFGITAEMLGFNHYIPSYLSSRNCNNNSYIFEGVNYASGSAGIRDETGSHLVNYKKIINKALLFVFLNKTNQRRIILLTVITKDGEFASWCRVLVSALGSK